MESNYFVATVNGANCVIHERFSPIAETIGDKDTFVNCLQAAAWKQVLEYNGEFIHIEKVGADQWADALAEIHVFIPFPHNHHSFLESSSPTVHQEAEIDTSCRRCKCVVDGSTAVFPFDQDINDCITQCNCCDSCRNECSQDI